MKHFITFIIVSLMLISCSSYKIAEHHINKKMHKAEMIQTQLELSNGDTVDAWYTTEKVESSEELNFTSGKPILVLVHGFGATTKYQWFEQVELLSEKYNIVAPNLLYFGKSRPSSARFTVQDQVEFVHNYLQETGITEYTLMGVSYGGLISMELTRQYPDEVKELIVFDAPVKFVEPNDIANVCTYFEVPNVEELFVPTEPKGFRKLLFLASGKNAPLPAAVFKEFHNELYAGTIQEKRKLITSMLSSVEEYKAKDYLFQTRTLMIWGSNDMVVPLARGERLAAYMGSHVEFHVIKNGAHMPNLTKTRKFNKLLSSFLKIGKEENANQ